MLSPCNAAKRIAIAKNGGVLEKMRKPTAELQVLALSNQAGISLWERSPQKFDFPKIEKAYQGFSDYFCAISLLCDGDSLAAAVRQYLNAVSAPELGLPQLDQGQSAA